MKSAALVISCLIFLLLAIPIATSEDVASIDTTKINSEVLQASEEAGSQELIPVIVKLREPSQVQQLGKLKAASAKALRAEKFQAFKAQEVSQLKEEISKQDFKVKRTNLREGYFSAYVTEQGLEELSQNPDVESISLNHVFSIALQDSVPLINASNLQAMSLSNGMKINGTGQTVCVVDSGINYTHPSLGGCQYRNATLTGTTSTYVLNSSHPYANNYSNETTITMPGYSNIAVRFDKMNLEPGYDFIYVKNASGSIIANYTGERVLEWSPSVPGNTIIINFTTDDSTTGYGYDIGQVINGTVSTTYNWSNCNKVIGGYDVYNSDLDPVDDNGHGTHDSGIVAASGGITGVAPGAKLVAVKVLNSTGSVLYEEIIADGIDWCVANKNNFNISVITMSIGTSSTYSSYCDGSFTYLPTSINNAISNGIIVTIATGNTNTYTAISGPACVQNATRITATEKDDDFASYANRGGSFTDIIAAPGSAINSTAQSTGSDCTCSTTCPYYSCQGTSMATPHAAGAAALLQQYKQQEEGTSLTPGQIEDALRYGGVPLWDTQSSMNYSRIRLTESLKIVDAKAPPLTLLFPTEGAILVSNNSISLNLSVTDVHLNSSSCKYSINFGANQTISNCTNTTFGVAGAGTYNLTVYANDLALNATGGNQGGNLNFSTVSFTISSSITMNLTSPANGSVLSPGAFLNFSISATSSISSVKYFNGTANRTMANTSATGWYINTTDWPTGQRDIIVYATDAIGSLESAAYTFFADYAPSITSWNWSNGTDSSSTLGRIYSRENDNLTINLIVNDTDAYSNLSYVWNVSNATSSRYNSSSQNLTWRIGLQDRGNYTISVNISDTKMSTTNQWNISISDFGSISWIAGLPDAVSEETVWTYNVSTYLNNPDNDPLTCSVSRYSIDSYGIITSSFGCSESGTYIVDVLVSDGITILGDTFYAVVTDSRACSSGGTTGGSSSSGNTTLDSVSKTFTSVSPQVESKFELIESMIPISEIVFKPKEILQNVKLTVKALSTKPVSLPEAPKAVYKYMEISTTNLNDSKISSARIEFKVENLWMTAENVKAENVRLVRYKDGWQNLTTTIVAKDATYTTFVSQVPGFSYFAITGLPEKVTEVLLGAAASTGTANQSEQTNETTEATESFKFPEIPFLNKIPKKVMLIIILLIITVVGVIIILKRYQSNQRVKLRPDEPPKPVQPAQQAKAAKRRKP